MADELDFSDISKVLIMVENAQSIERDRRDRAKEAKLFLADEDGQWEQDIDEKMKGRYQETFDMTTPIVDGVAGEIDKANFTLRVSPSGGLASEDTAKTIDGLFRNIRNISDAEYIFDQAGRSNIIGGFDAFEMVTDWLDGDSFDQDMFIRSIPNAIDSVWIDPDSTEPVPIDARWGTKLVSMSLQKYKSKWPEGGGVSVGDNSERSQSSSDTRSEDNVNVGQLYYKKPVKIDIVRMTNGAVYQDNDKFKSVQDELAKENPPVTIEVDEKGNEKRRTRDSWRVYSRMYDGADWLADEEITVFDYIPIATVYGNFEIIDGKRVYFGKLKSLMGPQRGLNFVQSRSIEDGAFSPPEIIWMTDEQAAGNDYSDINVSRDPIQIYTHVDGQVPPNKTPGPTASSGLQTDIANMKEMMGLASNTFQSQQGNAVSTQSGVAGFQQIEQANIGSIKWFKPLELAVCYAGKVLMSGLPRVYDSTRDAQVLAEDGTAKTVTLNSPTFDEQTGKNVVLNDLSLGDYTVTCSAGPAFTSAQKEAVDSFERMATIIPGMVERNVDIMLKNKSEPGMDLMAERERIALIKAGQIPESQLTEEEKAEIQAAQAAAEGNQQPDPIAMAAQGALLEGQAALQDSQNKATEIQGNQQLKQLELSIKDKEIDLKTDMFIATKNDKIDVESVKLDQSQQGIDQKNQQMLINADQSQQKLDLDAQSQRIDTIAKIQEQQQNEFTSAVNNLNTIAETMQKFVGPHIVEAGVNQAVTVTGLQEQAGDTMIGKEVAGTDDNG